MAAPRPLLVRLPNWLGDLVLAWPVVEAAAREGAIFVGPPAFEPLLAARFPAAPYLVWRRDARYALAGAIRAAKPAAALLLTESFSSALLMALAGVPERVGYAAEWRGALLTRRVAREAAARTAPRTSEYRALGRAAGLQAGERPSLIATAAERRAGASLVASRAPAASGAAAAGYLVVAPGAAYGPAKQWGGGRFGEAALSVARARGLAVVAVGSAGDRDAGAEAARVVAAGGVEAADLTGASDLPALVGILAGAVAVLSNDSGVMHLAAALGRPTVAVFGSTSPLWTSASAPWVASLYAAYPCSPCYRRACPIGYGCLRAIEPPAVAEAAAKVLA